MIELTNAYSYFASAILLLGWILTGNNKASRGFFGTSFFIAFGVYLVSSYMHTSDIESFLERLTIELFALSGAAYILTKLKSSPILNFLLFAVALIGFSQYAFHTDRTGGLKLENISSNGELLIELNHNKNLSTLQPFLKKYQLKIERAFQPNDPELTDLDDYYVVDIPDNSSYSLIQVFTQISKLGGVNWVEYNESIDLSPITVEEHIQRRNKASIYNDALAQQQWSFDILDMNQYFKTMESLRNKWKKTATIAILDTGIDSKHEDIKANYKSINSSYDTDTKGHGTHCAGIAAAVTNNGIGIASFAPSNKWINITSIKVLNKSGGGTQKTIIKGIIEAADQGVDVISMSLGARANLSRENAYKKAIKYANDHGAIVVVAAGNSNLDANTFSPANTQAAITVSAIDKNNNKATFSNYFTDMEYAISAPGVDIISTVPGDGYKEFSGTSMAAPHVAGLIGIMKSLKPDLTTVEAIRILQQTGINTNETNRTGKLIQPAKAVLAVVRD